MLIKLNVKRLGHLTVKSRSLGWRRFVHAWRATSRAPTSHVLPGLGEWNVSRGRQLACQNSRVVLAPGPFLGAVRGYLPALPAGGSRAAVSGLLGGCPEQASCVLGAGQTKREDRTHRADAITPKGQEPWEKNPTK